MNIYIANLSVNVTDEDLRELFSPYGTINSVKVIIDKETGKSKGFGFVELSTRARSNSQWKGKKAA